MEQADAGRYAKARLGVSRVTEDESACIDRLAEACYGPKRRHDAVRHSSPLRHLPRHPGIPDIARPGSVPGAGDFQAFQIRKAMRSRGQTRIEVGKGAPGVGGNQQDILDLWGRSACLPWALLCVDVCQGLFGVYAHEL